MFPLSPRHFVTTRCPVGRGRLEHLLGPVGDGRVDLTPLLAHDVALADVTKVYDTFHAHSDGVIKIALR